MFTKFFSKPAPAGPDPQTSLAALMVHVARADGDYDTAEKARIDQLLAHFYDTDETAATDLRRAGEIADQNAPDLVRFTRALKGDVEHDARQDIMVLLWAVSLSDGTRDHEESAVLRLVANLLGVNDRDSALARQRAEKMG